MNPPKIVSTPEKESLIDSDLLNKTEVPGGIKTMTAFIIVLAVHVVAIGGFAIWHFMNEGNLDANITNADKLHHDTKNNPEGVASTTSSDPATPVASTTTEGSSNSTADAANAAPVNTMTQTATPATTTSVATNPVTSNSINPVVMPASKPAVVQTPASAPAPVQEPSAVTAPTTKPTNLVGGATPAFVYTVVAGDSLARIARRNHCSVTKLKAANNLTSDNLHIGQKLTLPGTTVLATTSAPAQEGATAQPAATVNPSSLPHIYTVKHGDTLTRIAHRYKTTASALMTANSISDASKLTVGMKLKIPSKTAANNSKPTVSAPASQPGEEVQQAPDKVNPRFANSIAQ